MCKAATVIRVGKPGLHLRRSVIDAQLQIGVEWIGIDDLAGIHLPVRVPDLLELMHGFEEFGAILLHEKFGTLLPVAVLSGKRSAVGDNEVRSFVKEVSIITNALRDRKSTRLNSSHPSISY